MEVRRLKSDELQHHGIKGQRWGVRRYQNKDGSLTSQGRNRYGQEQGSDRPQQGDGGKLRPSKRKKTTTGYSKGVKRRGRVSGSFTTASGRRKTEAMLNGHPGLTSNGHTSQEYEQETQYNSQTNNFNETVQEMEEQYQQEVQEMDEQYQQAVQEMTDNHNETVQEMHDNFNEDVSNMKKGGLITKAIKAVGSIVKDIGSKSLSSVTNVTTTGAKFVSNILSKKR